MDEKLKQILATHPRLWRGSDRGRRQTGCHGLDTGYAALNAILHGGGWPLGVSNELLVPGEGVGELRLLMPALRQLSGTGYISWVAPPYQPFAPVLARQGVDLARLFMVTVPRLPDRLWAIEQCLLSTACVAVFGWLGRETPGVRALRRLQLAAEQSGCWLVLFRHTACRQLPSPSALRIQLTPEAKGRLSINVLKQPGGWAGQQLILSVAPHYEQWQRLPVELLPAYTANPQPVINKDEMALSASAKVTVFFPPSATSPH